MSPFVHTLMRSCFEMISHTRNLIWSSCNHFSGIVVECLSSNAFTAIMQTTVGILLIVSLKTGNIGAWTVAKTDVNGSMATLGSWNAADIAGVIVIVRWILVLEHGVDIMFPSYR